MRESSSRGWPAHEDFSRSPSQRHRYRPRLQSKTRCTSPHSRRKARLSELHNRGFWPIQSSVRLLRQCAILPMVTAAVLRSQTFWRRTAPLPSLPSSRPPRLPKTNFPPSGGRTRVPLHVLCALFAACVRHLLRAVPVR